MLYRSPTAAIHSGKWACWQGWGFSRREFRNLEAVSQAIMGVVPGLVSVGANSGILRRVMIAFRSSKISGFSRREFRNLEAVGFVNGCWTMPSSFSRREFRNLEAGAQPGVPVFEHGFSRREFRNLEAVMCAFDRSGRHSVSVGANSGILRRNKPVRVAAPKKSFSRREFRNLEAGQAHRKDQMTEPVSVGANSGILRRLVSANRSFTPSVVSVGANSGILRRLKAS